MQHIFSFVAIERKFFVFLFSFEYPIFSLLVYIIILVNFMYLSGGGDLVRGWVINL